MVLLSFSADMITMYTMIAEDKELSLQSHFYHVRVGSTPTAQKALYFLGGYCHKKGYYLAKRSNEDVEFRLRVAESLNVQVYELPCMVAKVEELVSHLRLHGQLPFQPADSANYRQFKEKTSPSFYLNCLTECLKRS